MNNMLFMADYYYNSFLANSCGKFLLLMIYICFVIFLSSIEWLLKVITSWRNIYLTKLVKRFYWSMSITIVVLFFYPLVLTMMLELYQK